jgi:hypothetical protein
MYVDARYERQAAQLDNYGNWVYVGEHNTWAWQPTVDESWSPYTAGRWYWTQPGWSWVSYEPWGWLPYHYGSGTWRAVSDGCGAALLEPAWVSGAGGRLRGLVLRLLLVWYWPTTATLAGIGAGGPAAAAQRDPAPGQRRGRRVAGGSASRRPQPTQRGGTRSERSGARGRDGPRRVERGFDQGLCKPAPVPAGAVRRGRPAEHRRHGRRELRSPDDATAVDGPAVDRARTVP